MMSLILAVITSLAIKDIEAFSNYQSPVGYELGSGEAYQNYRYLPQPSYFGNSGSQGGVSVLGQSNSASSFRSLPYFYPSVIGYEKSPRPQTVLYEASPISAKHHYPPYSLNQYYYQPIYESLETYTTYDSSKQSNQDDQQESSFDQESHISSKDDDTESALVGAARSSESSKIHDESKFRLTYLGYAPATHFRNSSHTSGSRQSDEQHGIPFYHLEGDSNPQSGGVLYSPYRFKTDLPVDDVSGTPSRGFGPSRPIVSPYSARPGSSRGQYSSRRPYSQVGAFPESQYRSQPSTEESDVLSTFNPSHNAEGSSPKAQDGYLLFDVEPVPSAFRLPGYKYRSSIYPTPSRPLVPTVTNSKTMNTDAYTNTGAVDQGEKLHKFEHQHYDSGYETELPHGHAYSTQHTEKGFSVEKYGEKEGQTSSNGKGVNTMGSAGHHPQGINVGF